ncbi:Mac1p Ecym_4579 [Eremothecium cymbalariae DBVPG|uniref:Copper-fist domain-containing protein n=1 Tax=Eremothecium cymbalariae (strain CBS 270.75 / DBVPG 7215 / KCTC 17166 / NRRL Y-17582) TaxID=931890 RepID=G8JS90_ERECY|nr:hypothetical protein Ecym_4579 [Eremothecium cymbalariae DBVPG\
MIIFDGDKYSCVACIRGHRSSTCKHSERMLVKVRTRGRPSPMDIRKVILVDANSKIKTPEESGSEREERMSESGSKGGECGSGSSGRATCSKMDKQPTLFLKALKKQKALLIDGTLKIMIEDKSNGNPNDKKFKFVTERDFLLKHSSSSDNLYHDGNVGDEEEEEEDCCGCGQKAVRKKRKQADGGLISHENQGSMDGNPSALGGEDFRSIVEPFTYKGVYLSTQCSCDDDQCPCDNCLIHRKEEELNRFIQQSGVPLTSLTSDSVNTTLESKLRVSAVSHSEQERHNQFLQLPSDKGPEPGGGIVSCGTENGNHTEKPDVCVRIPMNCVCPDHVVHPEEMISMNSLLLHGLFNTKLKRKTVIKHRGKLISSKYWWDFLHIQLSMMSESQLECLDLLQWFDNILITYGPSLPDAGTVLPELDYMLVT